MDYFQVLWPFSYKMSEALFYGDTSDFCLQKWGTSYSFLNAKCLSNKVKGRFAEKE